MSRFLFLTIILVEICLVRKISAVCKDFIPGRGVHFRPGDITKAPCAHTPEIKYDALCLPTGHWKLSYEQCNSNSRNLQQAAQVYSAPAQPPVYYPQTQSHSLKTCNVLISTMDSVVANSGPFYEGRTVRMTCQDKVTKYDATCTNGAWVYAANVCPGTYYNPTPPPTYLPVHHGHYNPTPLKTYLPVHQGQSFFDVLFNVQPSHVNVGYPGHASGHVGAYPTCPYLSLYMDPSDYGKRFQLNSLYTFKCPNHRGQRYIHGLCESTGWDYDLRQCEHSGGYRPYRPGRPFNHIIQEAQLPWWLIFRRGDTSIVEFENLIFL